jgi:hypothetical protein
MTASIPTWPGREPTSPSWSRSTARTWTRSRSTPRRSSRPVSTASRTSRRCRASASSRVLQRVEGGRRRRHVRPFEQRGPREAVPAVRRDHRRRGARPRVRRRPRLGRSRRQGAAPRRDPRARRLPRARSRPRGEGRGRSRAARVAARDGLRPRAATAPPPVDPLEALFDQPWPVPTKHWSRFPYEPYAGICHAHAEQDYIEDWITVYHHERVEKCLADVQPLVVASSTRLSRSD